MKNKIINSLNQYTAMKKKIFLLLVVLVITTSVFAENIPQSGIVKGIGNDKKLKTQKELIDSLDVELSKAKEDTNKVNILNFLAQKKCNENPDECVKLGEQARTLSKKLGWGKGEADALRLIGTGCLTKSDYKKAHLMLDSSLKKYKQINDKSGCSFTLNQIGKYYELTCDFPKALEYQEDARKIAEEIGDKNVLVNILKSIGNIYSQKSDNAKAFENWKKALVIAEEIDDKNNIGRILGNIGRGYLLESNYSTAMEYLAKGFKISEEINDKQMIGISLNHIGSVYKNLSNYPKALECFQKAIKYFEEIQNYDEASLVLRNIGEIYFDMADFQKSKEYYEKALKYAEEAGDRNEVGNILGNIGDLYSKFSNNSKALEYYEKALKIAKEIGAKGGIGNILGKIANIYSSLSKYTKALEYYEKAMIIAKETGYISSQFVIKKDLGRLYLRIAMDKKKPVSESVKKLNLNMALSNTQTALNGFKDTKQINFQLECNEQLSEIYEAMGDYKSSLACYKNAKILKESIFSLEIKKQISIMETKKDIEYKDKELALKDKENELLKQKNISQNLELKTKNYQLYGAIIGFFTLFFVTFIVLKERKKSEDLLLNILPLKIANRLKKKEHPIADHFEEASVVFIDMVDFTKSSSGADPKRVVAVLNILYTKLDVIAKKHGLEKIKTIGDCYMAAAGIPIIDKDNAIKAANFATEAMNQLTNYDTGDGTIINFRCGVDCGPVVAGVIGEHKFIYDIWGDTVNTAARMEEYGEQGKIQVTERFKDVLHLQDIGHLASFVERGDIEIKGKGMMRTYFLEGNNT